MLGFGNAFEDLINYTSGSTLRTVFTFDNSMNHHLQVIMRLPWKRLWWTTISVTNEAELNVAIITYRDGLGTQNFDSGELLLLTHACIFKFNDVLCALC